METIHIERTPVNDFPCLWESGGAKNEKYGNARIVTGFNGEPLAPIGTATRENGDHALFVIGIGSHFISATRFSDRIKMEIQKIISVPSEGHKAQATTIYRFDNGVWDREPHSDFFPAIKEARKKCHELNCRQAFYFREKQPAPKQPMKHKIPRWEKVK